MERGGVRVVCPAERHRDTDGLGPRRACHRDGGWCRRSRRPCAVVRRRHRACGSTAMIRHLATIARLEFVAAARLKWIRLLTAAFALLAAAAAYSAGAASELSGADGFARTTMALVPVVLILAPLAAIVLGVSGQAAEPGTEPFPFPPPV